MSADFAHFIAAQDPVYPAVLRELAAGDKQSHWMWFIFPQLRSLGRSPIAQRFGLADLAEARAYLAHPVLGPRLRECTALVNRHAGARSAHAIFGSPDDLKFRSSMTLFAAVGDAPDAFEQALQHFYRGEGDPLTLEEIGGG